MAYVNNIIGTDEKLVGIARLHWIYIIKGVIGFFACALFGWILNMGIYWLLTAVGRAAPQTLADAAAPAVALNNWLMPGALALGIVIFCFYLAQLISTEIALTSKRVIHKRGLLFVKTHEIDMEEIRGESLDLGWFGRILGYGFINLDCRFIGDVQLPAIENPERFLRILHELRTSVLDTVTMITGKGKPVVVDMQQDQPRHPPRHELHTPPMAEEEQRRLAEQQRAHEREIERLRLMQAEQYRLAHEARVKDIHDDSMPPLPPSHRRLQGLSDAGPLREDLRRGPDIPDSLSPSAPEGARKTTPPPPADSIPAAAVSEAVHRIIEEVVPEVAEKVAEKMVEKMHEEEQASHVAPEEPDPVGLHMTEQMKAEGLKAQPPLEKAKPPLDEELFNEFDEASTDVHPEQTVQVNPDQKPGQNPQA